MKRMEIIVIAWVIFLSFLLNELRKNKNNYKKSNEIGKIILASFCQMYLFLFTILISHKLLAPADKFLNMGLNFLVILWISFLVVLFCSVVKKREIEIIILTLKKKLNFRRKKK